LEKTSRIYREASQYGIQAWNDAREDMSLFSKYKVPGSLGSDDVVPLANEFNRRFLQRHDPAVLWDCLYAAAVGSI
jgi:hypothetical protein